MTAQLLRKFESGWDKQLLSHFYVDTFLAAWVFDGSIPVNSVNILRAVKLMILCIRKSFPGAKLLIRILCLFLFLLFCASVSASTAPAYNNESTIKNRSSSMTMSIASERNVFFFLASDWNIAVIILSDAHMPKTVIKICHQALLSLWSLSCI